MGFGNQFGWRATGAAGYLLTMIWRWSASGSGWRAVVRFLAIGLAIAAGATACSGDDTGRAEDTGIEIQERSGMQITSPAFADGGTIPQKYTCDGSDVSPPLALSSLPPAASSLVVIMEDPDAPRETWDHWVAFNIPLVTAIPENVGSLGTDGTNSWGRTGYGGPCPPSGTHRYFFKVYALDGGLDLAAGADKAEILEAMSGHVLAEAMLMARYGR